MTRRISLEDFDGSTQRTEATPQPTQLPEVDTDALRTEGYEAGYKSGWDDCHAEHLKSEENVGSDLARSLRDIEATYAEARADVLSAIRPVINTIVGQVLPEIANEALGALVTQELLPHLSDAVNVEPELLCSSEALPILRKLLASQDGISVNVRPDPGFSGAQVALSFGAETRNIELSAAVDAIGKELASFTERLIQELSEK